MLTLNSVCRAFWLHWNVFPLLSSFTMFVLYILKTLKPPNSPTKNLLCGSELLPPKMSWIYIVYELYIQYLCVPCEMVRHSIPALYFLFMDLFIIYIVSQCIFECALSTSSIISLWKLKNSCMVVVDEIWLTVMSRDVIVFSRTQGKISAGQYVHKFVSQYFLYSVWDFI